MQCIANIWCKSVESRRLKSLGGYRNSAEENLRKVYWSICDGYCRQTLQRIVYAKPWRDMTSLFAYIPYSNECLIMGLILLVESLGWGIGIDTVVT
jgi:hypothetical protein